MRDFEIRAAWFLGIALPLAEAARRRTDFSDPAAYVDDFLLGGLLLWAAWAAGRGRAYGRGLLIAAWGVLCGAMYYSFFGQLTWTGPTDVSGLPHGLVIAVKGAILATAAACLVLAVRRAKVG